MKRCGLLLLILSDSFLCQSADENPHVRMVTLAESLRGVPIEHFIRVNPPDGPAFMVRLLSGSTYGDLKEKIEQIKGIPYEYQILSHDGIEFQDDQAVSPMLDESPFLTIDNSQQDFALR
jgi:hypothetical protein